VGSSVLVNVLTAPLFQKVTGRRAEADINATMVMSLGMGMIVTEVLSHGFNLGLPVSFPGSLGGERILLNFGMVSLSAGQVSAFLASGAVVVAFFLLVYKTALGREFRAVAEDPRAARIAGIPLSRTGILSFAISGLLGGITALLLAMLLGYASAGLGEQISQKVLAVSIIAGLGNLTGGLVVGLMLGILEAIAQGYVAGTWSNAIAFTVMLAVILARPKGLFGSRV
jgi:branched-chain amino acid transport system permease protein